MRITKELRKALNRTVRAHTMGASPLAEVGLRGDGDTANALLWGADDDLGDLRRLAETKEIADDPATPGCAVLDLYVTTGTGGDRELETNVMVAIRDGVIVAASGRSALFDEKIAAINFPRGKGWV